MRQWKLVSPALAALFGFVLAACGAFGSKSSSFALEAGSSTPASTGEVKVSSKGDEQNRQVEIEARHLPLPSDLDPSKSTYVVWVDPAGDRPAMPMGEMQIGDNREGNLKLTTPFTSFEVFVTAESTATPSEPSELIVLQGQVDSRHLD